MGESQDLWLAGQFRDRHSLTRARKGFNQRHYCDLVADVVQLLGMLGEVLAHHILQLPLCDVFGDTAAVALEAAAIRDLGGGHYISDASSGRKLIQGMAALIYQVRA